ncbi:Wzz/FepE/Etk N-terminal domain-containing protein [Pelagibacterium sp. H642]|uniref:Wzz/FepE/Etk N-terminal domain-containing protein n=1 Tax=Pelagibacterium sp. H642 TaxID=1881069 RepID=UPI002815014D|nr:Wzz/FepE/Etk N-terminal domain-containing protein [Pelagibacterium sp. H642]WMT89358.1 Wzz/FepE/Etk N-terminal domain-containing protein [Pelagibacterium sp. H642]
MTETETANDEISLLDIAVVLAENWLLLVVVPIITALLAFGLLWTLTPRQYDSEALIRLNADEAALLTSARILNPAILNSDYIEGYQGTLSQARQNLIENDLTIAPQADTSFYRLSVSGRTPEDAQQLLRAILNSLVENSTPTPSRRALLELEMQLAEASVSELNATLERLNRIADSVESGGSSSAASLGEIGQSIVAILSNIESRRAEMLQIQEALEGSVSADDIIQTPTTPDSAQSRGIIIQAVLVGLGIGFLMLIVAFIRSGFKAASQSPDQLDKVNRIRRAFWLKPIKASDLSSPEI